MKSWFWLCYYFGAVICGQSTSLRVELMSHNAAARLFVFGRGLRFALRFFSACNPGPSNLHQYRFVLFRCSLRQTAAFCRILTEAVSVTVHDTFHFWVCSNVPSCKPGTLRTVPVEMNFADGTKAAIRRLSRALMGRNGERRNGEA